MLWQPGAQGSSPPPVITAPPGGDTSTLLGPDAAIEHPGIFQLAPESAGIDHDEFFKWELNGYLVVPGELSPSAPFVLSDLPRSRKCNGRIWHLLSHILSATNMNAMPIEHVRGFRDHGFGVVGGGKHGRRPAPGPH